LLIAGPKIRQADTLTDSLSVHEKLT
jgi:hypothetical protein